VVIVTNHFVVVLNGRLVEINFVAIALVVGHNMVVDNILMGKIMVDSHMGCNHEG